MPSKKLANLPQQVDFSSVLSPVRNQGSRGTCGAFAITGLHEAALAAGGAVSLQLSEELLYWGAKQVDSNTKSGTSFRSMHLALGKWGQSAAALWPYDASRNASDPAYKPPPEAIDPANCFKAQLSTLNLDAEEIKQSLSAGHLVAITVQMSNGFFDDSGVVPLPKPGDLLQDYHAILLTGYADGALALDGNFRFRNSWGTDWGNNGYGLLPYAYVNMYGRTPSVLNCLP